MSPREKGLEGTGYLFAERAVPALTDVVGFGDVFELDDDVGHNR